MSHIGTPSVGNCHVVDSAGRAFPCLSDGKVQ